MSIIKGKTNIVAGFGGTKRPLGEIYFSQSSLASDNPGGLPVWTGEYYENGSTLFPDLYNFVKANGERYVTKEQYDNAITTCGECPKYVVDEVEGSLRLPKYASNKRQLVKKEANGNDWYALYSDGWLEQGGYFGNPSTVGESAITETFWKSYATPPTVLFGNMSTRNQAAYDSEHYPYDVTANGFTHKKVQPNGQGTRWYAFGYAADTPMENILYPWVCAYTSTIPASTAQAAEFTGALSGKANTDLSNVLANIDYVVESKLPTADDPSWYRKYKSGWVEQGGWITSGENQTIVTLLIPYQDTNYSLIGSCFSETGNGGNPDKVAFNHRTTTTFGAATGFGAEGKGFRPFMWEAKGMGAE